MSTLNTLKTGTQLDVQDEAAAPPQRAHTLVDFVVITLTLHGGISPFVQLPYVGVDLPLVL